MGPVVVHYVEHGTGRPVLVLHGAGVDHREAVACFEPAFDGIAGLRRIYPDLPGMGRTTAPESLRSADDVLDTLLDFADEVMGGTAHLLIGHSAGAYFAKAMAARRPAQVAGLALVCPLLPGLRDVPEQRVVAGSGEIGDDVFRSYFVIQTSEMLGRYERYVAPAAALVDEAALERIGERWALTPDHGPAYPGPTLVVAGRFDSTVGYAAASDLVDYYPRASLAVVDDAGHALPHEQPELLRALIAEWLARVELPERNGQTRTAYPRSQPEVSDGEGAGSDRLDEQRKAFAVPPEIAYFNTANLSPQLHVVRAAGDAALERRAQPWTITARDWFTDVERLRVLFGDLIGADADGIALIPATSYGFAVAARNLPLRARERVVVLAEEYPSGIYTWQAATRAAGAEIVTVHRTDGRGWTEAILEVLDDRVSIVSVPHVHWTDGALVDLEAVAARSRQVGARLVIDGSQSIGAMPFDVRTIRPDFVVSVGYKWLLGPFGVGYLYVSPEHREGAPIEHNWILREGADDFARLIDYRDEYQPGARRFDVGERTKFELVPMAIAALEQLTSWRVDRIAAALDTLTAIVATRAAELGLEPAPREQRGPHMLGLRLPAEVRAQVLPALAAAGCYAGVRGHALRIAPHLHVTTSDVDRLITTLATITSGPAGAPRTNEATATKRA